jgi:hypothetical protein
MVPVFSRLTHLDVQGILAGNGHIAMLPVTDLHLPAIQTLLLTHRNFTATPLAAIPSPRDTSAGPLTRWSHVPRIQHDHHSGFLSASYHARYSAYFWKTEPHPERLS